MIVTRRIYANETLAETFGRSLEQSKTDQTGADLLFTQTLRPTILAAQAVGESRQTRTLQEVRR